MSLKEGPPRRPNSRVAMVYPLLTRGEFRRSVLEKETGLRGEDLTEAVRGNYRLGYVERPSVEDQRQIFAENNSASKGGEALAVRPYRDLDLTAKQTMVAIAYFDRKTYTQAEIARAYSREMHRHGLKRPVKELMGEAQRDKRRSEDELLEIVKSRKAAQRVIEMGHFEKPKTLREWHMLEAFAPSMEVSLSTAQLENIRDKAFLAQILEDSALVPDNPLEVEYLLTLWRAQEAAAAGDESLIDNFPEHYEEMIPEPNRLSKQRAIIYRKAQL